MGGNKKNEGCRQAYLRKLRAKLFLIGKTLNEVGEKTGYHPSYVTHVLKGRRNNEKIVKYIEGLR